MRRTPYTYLGLFISYFSITGISQLFKYLYGPQLSDPQALLRELLIFLMIGIVCLIIYRKEKLTLRSIGLYAGNWKRSLLWALVTIVLCGIALAGSLWISQLLGWEFGTSKAFDKLSLFSIAIIVLRAGIAEEFFFRGYIIERLSAITKNKYAAAVLSLVPFALFHYSQGYAGILVAFTLGAVLTGMYLWKRDLKSNMIAHFTIDFIPNVLLPLFGG